MDVREAAKKLLARAGLEVRRAGRDSCAERRFRVLTSRGISAVVDVGANVGQYGQRLRDAGYMGDLISFEPVPEAFGQLSHAAGDDPRWSIHNTALSDTDGLIDFHVSDDSVCSSALRATERLTGVLPDAASTKTIEVASQRLDRVDLPARFMLKIDTQGFEKQVIEGASGVLDRVAILDLELAFVELYEGGSSVYSILPIVRDLGFQIHSIEPGFTDPRDGQTLDADFLMVRPWPVG